MLVSYKKNFIFTKTVKTAGTSVEVFFEKYCFPDGEWEFSHARDEYINETTGIVGYRGSNRGDATFYNHMTAAKLMKKLPLNIWNKYFKFTVVRNPFDKVVSAFFHFEKSINSQNNQTREDIILRFREWVRNGRAKNDSSAYLVDGKVALDYFIRYENLKVDIEYVCNKIGVEFDLKSLPTLKSEHRDRSISLKDMYDEETESIVNKLYEFEIEYFKYELT